MKDVLVVDDLAQLKAMSNSYRIQIIHAFENEPATAKQLSEKLGEPHSKVNYHLKTLEKVGIVRLVCQKPKYGVIEKYYLPVAKNFILDSKSVQSDESFEKTIDKAIVAIFDRVSKDFYQTLETKRSKDAKPKKGQYIDYKADYYLTKAEADELHKSVGVFINDFLENKKQSREGTNRYSIATLITPLVKNAK